jgi:hypothetical protein
MDGVRCGYAARTADPYAALGMTRGGRLLLARLATWMDGIRSGYAARTADPYAALEMTKGTALQDRENADSYQ